jgi:hypothetical protein
MSRAWILAVVTLIVIAPSVLGGTGYSLLTVDQAAGFRGADWVGCAGWEANLSCSGVNFDCSEYGSQSTCMHTATFLNELLGDCLGGGGGTCWTLQENVLCWTLWLCSWDYEREVCYHPVWDEGLKSYTDDMRCTAHGIP